MPLERIFKFTAPAPLLLTPPEPDSVTLLVVPIVPARLFKVSVPVTPVAGAKASGVLSVNVPVARIVTVEPALTAVWMSVALMFVTPAFKRSPASVPVVLVVVMVTFVGSSNHEPPMPAWTTPGSSSR